LVMWLTNHRHLRRTLAPTAPSSMPSVQLQGWIGVCLASPYHAEILGTPLLSAISQPFQFPPPTSGTVSLSLCTPHISTVAHDFPAAS